VLRGLQELNLANTQVTDAGLAFIKDGNRLTTMNLAGTKVTNAGVKQLREELPKLEIIR